jgi:hypothetical protein
MTHYQCISYHPHELLELIPHYQCISYHPHELLEFIPVLPGLPGEILRDVDVGGLQQLRLNSTKLMSELIHRLKAEFPS